MAANKPYTLVSKTVTASEAGTPVVLAPSDKRWVVRSSVGTITGTSPTLDITIQHSADGTNWVTLIALAQLTGASGNSTAHTFAAAATDYLRPVLPYLRANYTVGGTTPSFGNVSVQILFDA